MQILSKFCDNSNQRHLKCWMKNCSETMDRRDSATRKCKTVSIIGDKMQKSSEVKLLFTTSYRFCILSVIITLWKHSDWSRVKQKSTVYGFHNLFSVLYSAYLIVLSFYIFDTTVYWLMSSHIFYFYFLPRMTRKVSFSRTSLRLSQFFFYWWDPQTTKWRQSLSALYDLFQWRQRFLCVYAFLYFIL